MRRLLPALALFMLGCTPGALTQLTGTVPSPTPEGTNSPDPAGSASPTPTPTPTASPTPSPTPTASPTPQEYVPFAIGVTVTAGATTLHLPPPSGMTARYAYTTTVSAEVLWSNGMKTHQVSWSSGKPSLATVDAAGTVTTVGTVGGTVEILGTSPDGLATASMELTVLDSGDAELTIE